jgi:calcium-dependent protein kinase
MSAVKYMHDHGIVHRDLKFENIMFENKTQDAEVKVIDFGLSKKFMDNRLGTMHEGVGTFVCLCSLPPPSRRPSTLHSTKTSIIEGTLYSMSPQVLQGVYTASADLWSCGVITYMLLSSHRPFYHKRRNVMIDRIMRADFSFEKDYWKPISDEAKNFIDQLLVLDPKKRMDAGQALEHIWLSKEFNPSDRVPDQSTSDAIKGSLIYYKNTSPLTKIVLNVIAHKVSEVDCAEVRTSPQLERRPHRSHGLRSCSRPLPRS